MSKVHTSIIAAVALALVAGCTEDEATSGSASTRIQTADVAAAPGDIAPSQVYALDHGAELATGEDRVSLPLNAQEALRDWQPPEGLSFKESTLFVEAGSAPGRILLPVDTPRGAKIYLASRVTEGTLDEQAEVNREVLADVKLYDPSHETLLNVREARDRPERPTEDGAAERTGAPLPSDPLAGGTDEATEILDPNRPRPVYAGEVEDRPLGAIELPDDAPAGNYILEYGPRAAEVGLVVEVRVPESTLQLDVAPSMEQLLLGGAGHVTAKLTDGDSGVSADDVSAFLVDQAGDRVGEVPVESLGEGEYRANVLSVLDRRSTPGVYNLFFRAGGDHADTPFQRFGWTAFRYTIPTARIVAASQPSTVKSGDLVRWFDVPVEIEVGAPDRYEVTGTLVWLSADGTERPVARAQTANVLRDDGTLTLRFDAGHLRLLNEQGRFELRHLTLYAQGQATQQHRITGGLGLATPEVEPSELAEAEITPAMEELMERGAFGL